MQDLHWAFGFCSANYLLVKNTRKLLHRFFSSSRGKTFTMKKDQTSDSECKHALSSNLDLKLLIWSSSFIFDKALVGFYQEREKGFCIGGNYDEPYPQFSQLIWLVLVISVLLLWESKETFDSTSFWGDSAHKTVTSGSWELITTTNNSVVVLELEHTFCFVVSLLSFCFDTDCTPRQTQNGQKVTSLRHFSSWPPCQSMGSDPRISATMVRLLWGCWEEMDVMTQRHTDLWLKINFLALISGSRDRTRHYWRGRIFRAGWVSTTSRAACGPATCTATGEVNSCHPARPMPIFFTQTTEHLIPFSLGGGEAVWVATMSFSLLGLIRRGLAKIQYCTRL